MKTNDLIENLVIDLKPVRLFKLNYLDFLKVFLSGILSIVASVSLLGFRLDIIEQLASSHFILENVWLLLLAVVSIAAVFQLSVPAHFNRSSFILPLLAVSLVLISTAYSFFIYSNPLIYLGHGFACVGEIFSVSILPAAVLLLVVRRSVVLNRNFVGSFIFVASVSFGLLAVQMTCADSTPLHALLWHVLPSALAVALGLILAKKLLNKI